MMDDKKAIADIVERVSRCPPSAVAWAVTEDKYGPALDVAPNSRMLCPFSFQFGPPNRYQLNFGCGGLHFETLQSSEFDPVVVVDAIMRGDVRERIWRLFDRIHVKAEGGIKLGDRNFLNGAIVLIPFAHYFATMTHIDYQPYPMQAE